MKNLIILLSLTLVASIASASDFSVGQIWDYQTRENEVGSRLTIVQIDELKGQEIIHISVEGLKIRSPQSPTGYGNSVSHLPIAPEALRASVTKLSGKTRSLPDYREGYQMWREAFDSDKGGFFTISVADCVEYMEQAINQ